MLRLRWWLCFTECFFSFCVHSPSSPLPLLLSSGSLLSSVLPSPPLLFSPHPFSLLTSFRVSFRFAPVFASIVYWSKCAPPIDVSGQPIEFAIWNSHAIERRIPVHPDENTERSGRRVCLHPYILHTHSDWTHFLHITFAFCSRSFAVLGKIPSGLKTSEKRGWKTSSLALATLFNYFSISNYIIFHFLFFRKSCPLRHLSIMKRKKKRWRY